MSTTRLVLLHGVGLDHTMWGPMRARLGERAPAIVAPDLLGHGRSAPAPSDVDLAALAAPVIEEMEHGDHLVGFSLGALVAQHIARHRPELVSTLTCVSSVCQRTESERAAVLERLAHARADFPASVESSLDRWFAGTDVGADTIAQTRAVLHANDMPSFLHCYRVFATADAAIAPQLGQIAAPTLAVTGALDPGSTPEMTQRLVDAIPTARAEVVAGARHMLPVQRPASLADTIGDFIEERSLA